MKKHNTVTVICSDNRMKILTAAVYHSHCFPSTHLNTSLNTLIQYFSDNQQPTLLSTYSPTYQPDQGNGHAVERL